MAARISTFLALLSAAASTLAAPSPSFYHISTHGKRAVSTGGQVVESYHPLASYQTFGDGIEIAPLGKVRRDDPSSFVSAASSFLTSQFGFDTSNFQAANTAVGDIATHVWFKQLINGKTVVNGVANVAMKDNKVVASGVNFVKPAKVSATEAKISTDDALAAAEKQLQGTRVTDVPVTTEYFLTEANEAVLVHVAQVQTPDGNHWYQAYVDATTGKVVGSVDFVAQAKWHVLPINKQDPTEGLETLTDPEDKTSSPNGWTTVGGKDTQATDGNNAVAFKASKTATTKASSKDAFEFDFDDTKDPTGADNLDSARTNAFFIVNTIHDITYRYGFDEASFNFQQDNNGKGGRGNDRVLISVQDGSGKNNANFATPPDGQSGTMRMFVWDLIKGTANRDGDMENDIVSHEMTHGITNRLTGGGTGTCLSTTEAGGMGEGWSDAMAFWLEQKDGNVKDFTMGAYVAGKGIRSHPYSTDSKVNPLTFADVAKLNEVHNIGEVWANMLVNVYAGLVADLGFSKDAFTNPDGKEGNVVFMHLFIDSLKLQPCNPTMVSARDAWIQADKNRYNGANVCTIFKAFASRGLGQNAPVNHSKNDDTIPDDCQGGNPKPTATVKPTVTGKPTETSKPTATGKPSSTGQPQPTSTVGVGKVNIVARFADGSTNGALLTRGTLANNTPATFQAAGANGGGFTIKTSRGSCGVADDATLSCGSGSSSVFQAIKDGNDLLLAFNEETTWSASDLPSRSAQLTVSSGAQDKQKFQLLITQV